jgi:hypothetical protein
VTTNFVVDLASGNQMDVTADAHSIENGALKFTVNGQEKLIIGAGIWTRVRRADVRLAGMLGRAPKTPPPGQKMGPRIAGRGAVAGIVTGRRGLPPRQLPPRQLPPPGTPPAAGIIRRR